MALENNLSLDLLIYQCCSSSFVVGVLQKEMWQSTQLQLCLFLYLLISYVRNQQKCWLLTTSATIIFAKCLRKFIISSSEFNYYPGVKKILYVCVYSYSRNILIYETSTANEILNHMFWRHLLNILGVIHTVDRQVQVNRQVRMAVPNLFQVSIHNIINSLCKWTEQDIYTSYSS